MSVTSFAAARPPRRFPAARPRGCCSEAELRAAPRCLLRPTQAMRAKETVTGKPHTTEHEPSSTTTTGITGTTPSTTTEQTTAGKQRSRDVPVSGVEYPAAQ